jgi:hypothetical protein
MVESHAGVWTVRAMMKRPPPTASSRPFQARHRGIRGCWRVNGLVTRGHLPPLAVVMLPTWASALLSLAYVTYFVLPVSLIVALIWQHRWMDAHAAMPPCSLFTCTERSTSLWRLSDRFARPHCPLTSGCTSSHRVVASPTTSARSSTSSSARRRMVFPSAHTPSRCSLRPSHNNIVSGCVGRSTSSRLRSWRARYCWA